MRDNFEGLSMEEIAKLSFDCSCAMQHSTNIRHIIIGTNVLLKLPALISEQPKGNGALFNKQEDRLLVVCDSNTKKAAGDAVLKILSDAGYAVDLCLFEDNGAELIAQDTNCNIVQSKITENTALLIAVGSGTINDITKYAAFLQNLPFYIVATAPSMDGYASSVAPMIVGALKYALPAKVPDAIIGDIDIIRMAPTRLFAAGFGDLVGKCVSICDWKLSHIITNEHYCPLVAKTVLEAVKLCTDNREGVFRREPEAVLHTMNALVLCGLMMSYVNSSRPASGSEHGLDHFWELAQIADDMPISLHGEGVGVGSVVSCVLYGKLQKETPNVVKAQSYIKQWDSDAWETQIRRICKEGADDVIQMEQQNAQNQAHTALPRLQVIAERWPEIVQIIQEYIPTPQQMTQTLRECHALATPQEMGLSKQHLLDAVLYAKDTRYRYSILQILWDMGLLDDYAQQVERFFYPVP